MNDSPYDDKARIARAVAATGHRAAVGGLWEELGELQLSFLKAHGLAASDHLLDVGCGCLRGGVRFAAYLDPGHYWGIDANRTLLDAGYDHEILPAGLADRLPRQNLVCDDQFKFEAFGRTFDAAIAQSLFTHLPTNRVRLCLDRLALALKPGGRFFATCYEVPENHPRDRAFRHPHGIITYAFKDPYHLRRSELDALYAGLPWRIVWAGDWGHPRDQQMVIFERL